METRADPSSKVFTVRVRTVLKRILLVFLGLFLALTLLEIGLRAAGWIVLSLRERANRISVRERDHYRILCLGESTTAGGEDSYPRQLETVLNESGIGMRFKVINKGVEATHSARILSRLDSYLADYRPDMVVCMMGVNDRRKLGGMMPYGASRAGRLLRFLADFRVVKLGRYAWESITGQSETPAFTVEGVSRVPESAGYAIGHLWRDPVSGDELRNCREHVKRARFYVLQGRFQAAERVFREIIAKEPENACVHEEMGWRYLAEAEMDRSPSAGERAVTKFEKAIELDPERYESRVGLALTCWLLGNRDEARRVLLAAVRVDPDRAWAYYGLGHLSIVEDRDELGLDLYDRAIEKEPRFPQPYFELAAYYEARNRFEDTKRTYLRAIEAGIRDDVCYGHLARACARLSEPELASKYREEARRYRLAMYQPATRHNYNRLKEKVAARGLRLVCVQYPLRSVAPLRRLLEPAPGVLFVDNEEIFKNAVKDHGYDHLFIDRFAGDFGHCTREGNRILAENVAASILTKAFDVTPSAR